MGPNPLKTKEFVPHMRPIPGFPGYWADSSGDLWSLRKGAGKYSHNSVRWGAVGWRKLGNSADRYGYCRTLLMVDGKTKGQHMTVHRAVCLAFHGPAPRGNVVAHLNGNKLDNRPGNLSWATQAENVWQAMAHGTHVKGDRCHTAKLNDLSAREILTRTKAGERASDLAREFGITDGAVCALKAGRTWKHLHASLH